MFEGISGKLLEINAATAQAGAGGAVESVRDSGPAGILFVARARQSPPAITLGRLEGVGSSPALVIADAGDQYGTGGLVADGVPLQKVTGGPDGFTLLYYGAIDSPLDGAILDVSDAHVRCFLRVYQGALYFQHGGSNAEHLGVTNQVLATGGARIGSPALYVARVWPDGRAELRRDGQVLGSAREPVVMDFAGTSPVSVRIGWKEPGSWLPSRTALLATFSRALSDAELEAAAHEIVSLQGEPLPRDTAAYEVVSLGDYAKCNGVNSYRQIAGTYGKFGGLAFLLTPQMPGASGGTLITLPKSRTTTDQYAAAINDFGQVAMSAQLTPEGKHHAVLWTPLQPNGMEGTLTDLGLLGGHEAKATAVNTRGAVVGVALDENARWVPFVWRPDAPNSPAGQIEKLSSAGGYHAYAHGINDAGQVVGFRELGSGVQEAVVWEDGGFRVLGSFFGRSTRAQGINNRGQIVGNSGGNLVKDSLAWILDPGGTAVDLPRFDGLPVGCVALSVNDDGYVAGTATVTWFGLGKACFWPPHGGPVRLPDFGQYSSALVGPRGWLVGTAGVQDQFRELVPRAVSWQVRAG